MKNTENYNLGKYIFMTLDEFKKLVEELTDGLETVEYEFGVYITETDKAYETDVYWNKSILETLSEYFDVNVTSYHSDDCDIVGVFICYKEKEED